MRVWLLILVAAAQLAIPAFMIQRQETILREGRAFKFKTRPVDPADAFRGRYVQLGFEQDRAPWRGTAPIPGGAKAYASLEEGADGFAVVRDLGLEPPTSGEFIKVRVNYAKPNDKTAYFSMPFDRFYMEESKAPEAERVYREQNGPAKLEAYAVVRVASGHAALENVFVGGKPLAR